MAESTTPRKLRRAQIIVLAPVMLAVLGAILALTADVGHLFVWRARLQNAADASALAAIHVLVSEKIGGATEESARAMALSEGNFFHHANGGQAGINLEFGERNESGDFVVLESGQDATAVRTTAYRTSDAADGPVGLFFAQLIGIESCDVVGDAIAEVISDFSGVVVGLAPFAVPEDRIVPPDEDMVFYPADGDAYDGIGDLTIAAGCWGLLNLDGGALGTVELVDWIENGYDAPFEIDPEEGYVWIDGTSGFRAALETPVEDKIGESIIVVMYDDVVGVGATADFRCTGFVRVTIVSVDLTGNDPHITCTVEEIGLFHDLLGGGLPSPNMRKIQLVD